METGLGPQFRADGRSHLPERGITLHGKEPFYLYAACLRNSAEIVPHQVNDHHIFAAVLGVIRKPFGDLAVLTRRAPAPRSPFHGSRDDTASRAIIVDAEEQLRREREDAAARLAVQERTVIDWLACSKPRVKCRRTAWRFKLQRRGEVQLINVSGANPLVNLGDALRVFGFVEREFRGDLRLLRSVGRFGIRQPAVESFALQRLATFELSRGVIESVASLVDPKPGKRRTVIRRAHSSLRLKAACALVAEEACCAMARRYRALNFREERRNLRHRIRYAHAQGGCEQLCPRFFLVFGVVLFPALKQHRGRRLLHQRIDFRRKGMPPRHAGSVLKNRRLP